MQRACSVYRSTAGQAARAATLPTARPTAGHMPGRRVRSVVVVAVMAASLLAAAGQALAQGGRGNAASELSALSVLPVALVGASAAGLVSGGAVLTVAAIEASADGTEWLLTRASDGARVSVRVAGGASVAVGEVVTVTAVTGGLLLSAAGRVIAWVPDQLGRALSHHERVTR